MANKYRDDGAAIVPKRLFSLVWEKKIVAMDMKRKLRGDWVYIGGKNYKRRIEEKKQKKLFWVWQIRYWYLRGKKREIEKKKEKKINKEGKQKCLVQHYWKVVTPTGLVEIKKSVRLCEKYIWFHIWKYACETRELNSNKHNQ